MKNKLMITLALSATALLAAPQLSAAEPVGHTVSGVFTNDCGDGSAWVELRTSDNVKVDSTSVADGGQFQFTGVADGDYRIVPFAPAGCGVSPFPGGTPVTVAGEDEGGLAARLVTVNSIWGVVTGCEAGDGNGVNGVRVEVEIDTEDLTYSNTNITQNVVADGQFFFQYLPAVEGYTVTVIPPEGCRIADPTIEVDLSDGDVEDVAFALELVPPSPSGSLGSLGPAVSPGSMALFGSLGS